MTSVHEKGRGEPSSSVGMGCGQGGLSQSRVGGLAEVWEDIRKSEKGKEKLGRKKMKQMAGKRVRE